MSENNDTPVKLNHNLIEKQFLRHIYYKKLQCPAIKGISNKIQLGTFLCFVNNPSETKSDEKCVIHKIYYPEYNAFKTAFYDYAILTRV